MARIQRRVAAAVAVALLAWFGVGCGQDDGELPAAPASDARSAEGRSGVESEDDISAFCDAVEALDRTDGTTDSAVVLAAIEEMRTTAPSDIRDDVTKSLDSLVILNYPDAADPAMQEVSFEERQTAGVRLRAYLEERC